MLRELTDDAIDTLLESYAASPSHDSFVSLQQVGGAIARVPRSETPYVNRDALYDCFPISIWDDPRDDDANIAWTLEMWSRMTPYASGGVYVNNLGDEGPDRVKAAYGENYPRLGALKSKYDPRRDAGSPENEQLACVGPLNVECPAPQWMDCS